MTAGRKRAQQPATRYFIDDDGGYASGYGPMADALLKFPEWREVTQAEHDTVKRANPEWFGEDEQPEILPDCAGDLVDEYPEDM
jgi:hypothetical protein